MLKFILILAFCIHASLAVSREGRNRPGYGKNKHGAQWNRWASKDGSKMDSRDLMLKMYMMRMKGMLEPMRKFFTKVLAIEPIESFPGRPNFCRNNECPKFTVINKTDVYQLRCYKKAKWISTQMQGTDMHEAIFKCYRPLHMYFNGKNNRRKKYKRTAPVTILIKPDKTPNTKNFTLSFYLPSELQSNPPQPINPKVKLEKKKATCYYVHSFPGWVWGESTYKMHAKMLMKKLNRDGLEGKFYTPDEMYIFAGYDDQIKMFKRHNEVWLMAKGPLVPN